MTLIRAVYLCLGVIGAGLILYALVQLAVNQPQYTFLFIFSGLALLTIADGELRHPTNKPYLWGNTPATESS